MSMALRYLRTEDDLERNLMTDLARRIAHERQLMDKNLAVEIANNVSKLFSKK